MAHAEPSRAQAHSEATILVSYLAEQGHVLAEAHASDICSSLILGNFEDIKAAAKPLRDKLREHGIALKHTNALEALSRIAGYTCYMRARNASAGPAAIHILLTTIEGETRPPQGFASIGELVTALLATAIGLIPARNEPAFCRLRKYPSGFQLEVSQEKGVWFALQCLRVNEDTLASEVLGHLPFEDESFRTAIRRVVSSIEQARPAALVLGGVVTDELPPCYSAVFQLTALGGLVEHTAADERELFVYLDAVGGSSLQFENGIPLVSGTEERFRIEPVWFDQTGRDTTVHKVDARQTMKSVLQRFLRFRQTLPGTVAQSMVAVGGSGDAMWHARPSFERIESLASDHQLSIADLARNAGVKFRDIKRMQEFDLADPGIVIKVAAALGVSPESLLSKRETTMGFSAENGEQFMKMVSGAMAYELVDGESLTPGDLEEAQALLEVARDISELSAFESSDFGPGEAEVHTRHATMAQELLDDAESAGLKLILARTVRFVKAADSNAGGSSYLAMNVLTICVDRADTARPAIWTPV